MPQQVRRRYQTTVNYQANGRRMEKLSRGMIYRELALRLTGSINVGSNFATAGQRATLASGEEWGVVERIDIIANGSDTLRSISGEELRWWNLFWFGNPPRTTFAFANAADSATVAFDSTIILPFWMPRSIHPIDTALDATRLSDLTIEITWAGPAQVSKGTSAAFVAAPVLEVYSLESFGVVGPFSQSRIFRMRETAVASQDEFQIQLPVGNLYRSFLLHAKQTDGDDILNWLDNLKIRSGTTIYFDVPGNVIQDWEMIRNNVQERAIDPNRFATTPAVTGRQLPYFVSSNSDVEAWYLVDLVTDGRMTEAIDTLGFSELIMELDINQTVDVLDILPLQIIPVRQPAK